MSRNCPICERQPLHPNTVQGVEIETCSGCGGLWFEAGKLERFPDRPAVKALLPLARQAPGRCRRRGHAISRAMVRCSACGGAPAQCPVCNARLAMVPTSACAMDICIACEGVWLDAGEFEALRGIAARAAVSPGAPTATTRGWEIPASSAQLKDLWLGPGQVQAPQRTSGTPNVRAPFSCRQCGGNIGVADAWAYDGEIYCERCRPPGAVSGHDLPPDSKGEQVEPSAGGLGHSLISFLSNLLSGRD